MTQNWQIKENDVIGLIPARGGSKSIPLKNIKELGGHPLVNYCVKAGCAVMPSVMSRVICSTDHQAIADTAEQAGAEIIWRPEELSGDASRTEEAVVHVLEVLQEKQGFIPEMIVLLQPTSPFVLTQHVTAVVDMLQADKTLDTVQTITTIPHNMHAFSQRTFDENARVDFNFREERLKAFNKQNKPKFYRFGNIVAFRSQSILDGNTCFGVNSGGVLIEEPYAMDVDGPADFDYAEYLIARKIVDISFVG